jgi:hypothetical protein
MNLTTKINDTMFVRPLIRFLGYRIRLLCYRLLGKGDILRKLNSTEDQSEAMIQEFTNALIGLISLILLGFLGSYLIEYL